MHPQMAVQGAWDQRLTFNDRRVLLSWLKSLLHGNIDIDRKLPTFFAPNELGKIVF